MPHQQRLALHLQQGLGRVVGQRAHALAPACGQQQGGGGARVDFVQKLGHVAGFLICRSPFQSDPLRPFDLQLAMAGKTVAQIKIDEALVWNASFFSHAFEILNNVFREPHGHGLL
jgi:hypothetical protein